MSGELILIVEDQPLNRKLVRDVLQAKGYRTVETETAEEGLRVALDQRPALILMDIQLPGINGIEALKRLRADPATRAIPIIAVTASAMQQNRQEILAAGFDGYQPKPINVSAFLKAVRETLDERSEGSASSSRTSVSNSAKILVVDDTPRNVKLLADLLAVKGYEVITAASGAEALERMTSGRPDLVLLDVVMPGMTGYEVCRRIRDNPATVVLPVVMVTALDPAEERIKGIEAGADDFLTKPISQPELLARVRSLLRIKSLHDQVEESNRTLERRVAEQVEQLERLSRLKRFFSPQLAELILSGSAEDPLKSHRREITVVFLDLRGFTAFAETAEPEEVMGVLRDYHAQMGRIIMSHDGTLERFAGDGMMVFFNDPVPVPDPAVRAVRMVLEMHERLHTLAAQWQRHGFELDFGVGIAQGYATIGAIGFEGRLDYGAIGTVTNLAARLCSEAQPGQILISKRVLASVDELVEAEPVGALSLKGFVKPVPVFNVTRLKV